ncbi:Uncharacterised protein [Mycobacteroides abscessus]|nr:Uncharacterised protein [Mycobacteroides abscessus]
MSTNASRSISSAATHSSSGRIASRDANVPIWSRFAYTTSGGLPDATAERKAWMSSSPSERRTSTPSRPSTARS